MATTPRWGLRYPLGSDAPDVPLWMERLATDLDNVAMDLPQGLLASRPSASKAGQLYWATDAQILYRDTGTAWIAIGPNVAAGGGSVWTTGDVKPTAAATTAGTEPAGWLLCDGRQVARESFAALYASLGAASSPYGQGNGSTTFNLPDYRGRTLVGRGTHASVDALGDNEGAGLGNRTPKHRHGTDVQGYHAHGGGTTGAGAHNHGLGVPNVARQGSGPTFNFLDTGFGPVGNYGSSGVGDHAHGIFADGAHGHNVGDQSGPVDGPAFSVVHWLVKT
jgi:Phage Tail Collar Domain